jgi:hypothetical protein
VAIAAATLASDVVNSSRCSGTLVSIGRKQPYRIQKRIVRINARICRLLWLLVQMMVLHVLAANNGLSLQHSCLLQRE